MLRGDRLKALMAQRGLSQNALAEMVGVKQPTIARLISGEQAGSKHLHRIAAALGTTAGYLAGDVDDPAPDAPMPALRADESDSGVEITSINLAYGMGGAYLDSDLIESETMRFPLQWLQQFTDSPPHLLTIAKGIGDSMEPTISDGDSVLIDRGQSSLRDSTGERIWAAVFGGVGVIKRLRPMPNGTVKIMSDNPLVSDDIASDGDLFIIGRVVGKTGRL